MNFAFIAGLCYAEYRNLIDICPQMQVTISAADMYHCFVLFSVCRYWKLPTLCQPAFVARLRSWVDLSNDKHISDIKYFFWCDFQSVTTWAILKRESSYICVTHVLLFFTVNLFLKYIQTSQKRLYQYRMLSCIPNYKFSKKCQYEYLFGLCLTTII